MPQLHRILIVDDEEVTRDLLRLTLQDGYEVVEAQDGLDALDNIDDIEPDFIIMDSMMPLMDGYQTTEAIRRNPKHPQAKVLFLSVLADRRAIEKGYAAGADMYLTKPFDPQRLKRNVDVFFENNPIRPRPKRYSLKELVQVRRRKMQQKAREALTAQTESKPPPPAKPTPVKQPTPVTATPPPVAPTPGPDDSAEPMKARVMVVDDDKEILDITRLALQPEFEVVTAEDGLEAIEKIVHCEPDIVLLDAMMPKLSGYQLCQSLRRNSRYQNTPIVFISVKATPKDREYARKMGANAFLPKPFDPDELERLVQTFSQAPEFHVRAKKMTLSAIRVMEEERRNLRALREVERNQPGDESELRQFIRDELMNEEK